jgi:hypothetical protein
MEAERSTVDGQLNGETANTLQPINFCTKYVCFMQNVELG